MAGFRDDAREARRSKRPNERIANALSPGRAFLALIAIVALLAGLIALDLVLHMAAIFAGSFFLFYWLGVEKAAPAAFMSTLAGALGGIANAGVGGDDSMP